MEMAWDSIKTMKRGETNLAANYVVAPPEVCSDRGRAAVDVGRSRSSLPAWERMRRPSVIDVG